MCRYGLRRHLVRVRVRLRIRVRVRLRLRLRVVGESKGN